MMRNHTFQQLKRGTGVDTNRPERKTKKDFQIAEAGLANLSERVKLWEEYVKTVNSFIGKGCSEE